MTTNKDTENTFCFYQNNKLEVCNKNIRFYIGSIYEEVNLYTIGFWRLDKVDRIIYSKN